jgi:hypothetical protein
VILAGAALGIRRRGTTSCSNLMRGGPDQSPLSHELLGVGCLSAFQRRKPGPAAQALIHGVRRVRASRHEVDDGDGSDCRSSLAGLFVGLSPPNRLQYVGVPGRLRSQYGVSNCGF